MCAHAYVCMHVKDPLPFFVRVRASCPGGGFLFLYTYQSPSRRLCLLPFPSSFLLPPHFSSLLPHSVHNTTSNLSSTPKYSSFFFPLPLQFLPHYLILLLTTTAYYTPSPTFHTHSSSSYILSIIPPKYFTTPLYFVSRGRAVRQTACARQGCKHTHTHSCSVTTECYSQHSGSIVNKPLFTVNPASALLHELYHKGQSTRQSVIYVTYNGLQT